MPDQTPPEIRQCVDPTAPQFGSVAVNAGENRWGIFNPSNGGHWTDDNAVADWKVKT